MKKVLAVTLVMVFVVGLLGGVALAENEECVRYGQGYWKHWLDENDYADCPYGFTDEQLLGMLDTPARGNPTQILLYQFIAAFLNMNVYGCVPPPVVGVTLNAAGEHLLTYLVDGEGTTDDRSEILGWKDILEFWNGNQYAELQSVVYEGEGDLFGDHIDDKIVFTFSNDVFHDPNVEVTFKFAQELWEGWGADNWILDGNTATVTLNRLYGSPRDIVGDKVVDITGLFDAIGNTVVVPADGVEVT